jgi:hypothetical protein
MLYIYTDKLIHTDNIMDDFGNSDKRTNLKNGHKITVFVCAIVRFSEVI